MKICVCSDSHGATGQIQKMLTIEKPDILIFLGDGWHDIKRGNLDIDVTFFAVRGNCYIACLAPEKQELFFFGEKLYICHGHKLGVKNGPSLLAKEAILHNATVAIHGHTHIQNARIIDGILILCPGSIGYGSGEYMLLNQNADSFSYTMKSLNSL